MTTTDPSGTRTLRLTFAIGALLAVLTADFTAPPPPAAGQARGGCEEQPDRSGKCEVGAGEDEDGSGPGPGGGASWMCRWRGPLDAEVGRRVWPDAPEWAGYWVFHDCGYGGGNDVFDPWEQVGYMTGSWLTDMEVVPGPLPPPSPHELAESYWAEVQATLPAPELVVSPPVGRAAIVDHPTFLAVSNWSDVDPAEHTRCDDVRNITCVSLSAQPRLSFDPGDGSDPIACAGAGTVFDPTRDPDAQADAPGACAHRYSRRTGVAGRPDAWTATATVTWEVTWSSQNPDASGSFDDLSLSTTIDRRVDELQGLVVDADGGLP